MTVYQILTDSCCDLTKQQYADLTLTYVPLTLQMRGEAFESFTEPDALHAFYDCLRAGELPTTSAVNPDAWGSAMERILRRGEDVLCLCFSSALSTTHQSACIAAQELREKYPARTIAVVDTLCASMGQGFLAYHACLRRDAGASLQELTEWVEQNKLRVCHEVTVDDLDHLKRGGRIGAATAFVGGMLGIKPMIFLNDEGKLINHGRVRGRKAAIDLLVNRFSDRCTDFDTVFIAHGDCPEDAAKLEAQLRAAHPEIKTVRTGYVGSVIGAHTGPAVLVVFFFGNAR